MPESEYGQDSLWIRYVDWCSAQVAKRFISLSPDEVWTQAAEHATQPDQSSILQLARALTMQIYEELELPTFESWLVSYKAEPERFDRDILGFPAPDLVPEGMGNDAP
jgi:hypothetical protein